MHCSNLLRAFFSGPVLPQCLIALITNFVLLDYRTNFLFFHCALETLLLGSAMSCHFTDSDQDYACPSKFQPSL